MTIGASLERKYYRASNGTLYIFGYRDDLLRMIYRRELVDRGGAAGGLILQDSIFWHVKSSRSGRLSKRAQAVVDSIFGLSVPEDLRFNDARRKRE